MSKPRTYFTVLLFLLPVFALAQGNRQTPCSETSFDFWVGDWELTWPAEQFGGKKGTLGRGSNAIKKTLGGCVVEENFRFPAGSFNGHSVSVFNAKKNIWQQTWVDNQGGYLLFEGNFKNDKMELRTNPRQTPQGTVISRMVFKNISTDSLDWDWQKSTDNGKTWQDQWNIHYKRRQK